MRRWHIAAKKLRTSSLVVLLAILPLSIQAATLEDLIEAINNFRDNIIDWVDAAKQLYLEQMFEENATYPYTVAGSEALTKGETKIQPQVTELSISQIKQALTREKQSDKTLVLSAMPGSDSYQRPTSTTVANITGRQEEAKTAALDAKFDIASLIAPAAYTSEDDKKNATNYIDFLMQTVDPISTVDLSTLSADQRQRFESSPAGRDYRLYLRSLVAARAIAENNLLRLYAERLPAENLGKDAGMKQNDASPLEVQKYIATRRTDNIHDWYKSMVGASFQTVQRENLFIQAETQRQIYELHMDNERILATLSAILLENMKTNQLLNRQQEAATIRELSKK